MLLLAICVVVLAVQLFVPPLVGLADNGDFPKVLGRVGLRKPAASNFHYFVSSYSYAAPWNTVVWYSETVPAWIAVRLQTLIRGNQGFDIRYLAAVHVAVFVTLYYFLLLLLRKTRPLTRVLLALLVLWIFTDVCYVAYFNSFYSDAVAFLSLLAMVISALHIICRSPRSWAWWSVYTIAALFFATSKAQHAIWAIFPAAFSVVMSWRADGVRRILGVALGSTLLALSLLMFANMPDGMKAFPLFDLVFLKLASQPGTQAEVLRGLGLPETYGRYAGVSAWMPESPIVDAPWRNSFYAQVRPRLPGFYLSHPRLGVQILHSDLRRMAPDLRPPNLANYRQEDGYPPDARARHFCSWSDLRSGLLHAWPEHILLWYVLVVIAAIMFTRRRHSPVVRGMAAVCLALALMGMGEFCFASLTDATQTDRHLFLFHALTDFTFCFAMVGGLEFFQVCLQKRSRGQLACTNLLS